MPQSQKLTSRCKIELVNRSKTNRANAPIYLHLVNNDFGKDQAINEKHLYTSFSAQLSCDGETEKLSRRDITS